MTVRKSVLSLSASVIIFFGMLTSAHAASQCKGLNAKACESNASCSLVGGYVRKDGREVKAFCRTSTKGISKKVADKKS